MRSGARLERRLQWAEPAPISARWHPNGIRRQESAQTSVGIRRSNAGRQGLAQGVRRREPTGVDGCRREFGDSWGTSRVVLLPGPNRPGLPGEDGFVGTPSRQQPEVSAGRLGQVGPESVARVAHPLGPGAGCPWTGAVFPPVRARPRSSGGATRPQSCSPIGRPGSRIGWERSGTSAPGRCGARRGRARPRRGGRSRPRRDPRSPPRRAGASRPPAPG